MPDYPRVARFRSTTALQEHLNTLNISIPVDEKILTAPESPLAQAYQLKNGRKIGNRWCIHPMEGWDGTLDGQPSELTLRRWSNFGLSGAKLIWGGEAVAVRHDGRANPNQLMFGNHTRQGLSDLRKTLLQTHRDYHGSSDDLLLGIQLTHSGRFSRPNGQLEPRVLYHHPLLENIYPPIPDSAILSDTEIDDLIGDFVTAAKIAQELGFDFVDVKHCHGYLGHEFLSSRTRPGTYGGSFENRTRFLHQVVNGVRRDCPGLLIGVRVSIFDTLPFRPGPEGVGIPLEYKDTNGEYPYAFGADPANPLAIDLTEPIAFLQLLQNLEIELVNLTAGSPYYNPHIQRPAIFPPSDGYQPPEDPLVGVARQLNTQAELKPLFPDLALVGTGYTYLQDFVPLAAQAAVGQDKIDFVGIGRMVLSYPEMPGDVLAGKPLQRKLICRTFSDCTTAPRKGLVSGCYPLDHFYKDSPDAEKLIELKKAAAS